MEPLLLKPPIKDYLWGGTKLKEQFGFETDKEITAEAWLLSCHKDGSNVVMNGEFKGKALPEVLELWGKEALGEKAADFEYFPLLIKFIDAKQSLSVQVHPDDKYAKEVEGEYGKTEMWYVVDCEEGASLIYGFNREVSRVELEQRIKDNTLPEICNYVPVKKGDVFFIEAGTLHAIGGGILIAEVQQNSNSTYRVSDFGRLGADGKPRELHIDKALDVTRREKPTVPYGQVGEVQEFDYGTKRQLASCDLFTANIVELRGTHKFGKTNTFVSLIVLDGKADVSYADNSFTISKGDSLFVPASFEVNISGKAKLLYSCV